MFKFFSDISTIAGAVIGLLQVLDWFIPQRHKNRIRDFAETAYYLLDDQRTGKFLALLRNRKLQIGFSIFTHIAMLVIVTAFLGRVFLGWNINASLDLGRPRVYPIQAVVDVITLCISAIIISFYVHPKVSNWLGNSRSTIQYFCRALKVLGLTFGGMFLGLIVMLPIEIFVWWGTDVFNIVLETPEQIQLQYESRLSTTVIFLMHGFTSAIMAPIVAEGFMMNSIVFLSFYWLLIVLAITLILRALQYVAERVAEAQEGPVMSLAGILILIGVVGRVLTAK